MIPYVQGNLPIYIHANEVRQIEAAVHWANRHDVKIVLVGGKDAWRTTDLLKKYKIPVIYEGVIPYHQDAMKIMIRHIKVRLYSMRLVYNSVLLVPVAMPPT